MRHRKALLGRRLLRSRPPRTKAGEARHLVRNSPFVSLYTSAQSTIRSIQRLTALMGPVTSDPPGSTTPSLVATRAPPDLSDGCELLILFRTKLVSILTGILVTVPPSGAGEGDHEMECADDKESVLAYIILCQHLKHRGRCLQEGG